MRNFSSLFISRIKFLYREKGNLELFNKFSKQTSIATFDQHLDHGLTNDKQSNKERII